MTQKTQRRMIDGKPMKRRIDFNSENVITSRGEWRPDGDPDEAPDTVSANENPEPDGQPHETPADDAESGELGMAQPSDPGGPEPVPS